MMIILKYKDNQSLIDGRVFLKKWIFITSLVFFNLSFASHASTALTKTEVIQSEHEHATGMYKAAHENGGEQTLKNANCTFQTPCSNGAAFAFAEALIWQVGEANADNWGQILGPTGTAQTIQFLDVPFKWSPGFRVGIGYSDKENPWSILLYYTRYDTQGTSQASTGSGTLHSAFSSNFYANNSQGNGLSGPDYHQAGIQWDVILNNLDLELSQQIKIDEMLDLSPFLGLKAGMINQDIHTTWQNPYPPSGSSSATFTSATEQISNHFKGLGPSLGLQSNWHLYTAPTYTLNLVGHLSGALLWGNWTMTDVYQNDTPETISTVNDSLSSAATMARAYLGIGWSSVINKANVDLLLSYEEQVWFNQLQYYSFDLGKTNDALYLQGVVLSFGIHF